MTRSSYLVQLSILLLALQSLCSFASETKQPKKSGDGKNILVYLAVGSYSMRISIWPLIEGLIEKGHHVTFLSMYDAKAPDPRVTEFVPPKIKALGEVVEEDFDFMGERKSGKNRKLWYDIPIHYGLPFCETFYDDPDVMEWIRKSKFDLVVVDSVNECAYGLAHYFKAKTVVYSTFNGVPWAVDAWGTPDDSSWAADMTQYFPTFMPTFVSRIVAAVNPLIFKYIRELTYFPQLDEVTKKALGKLGVNNVPTTKELEENTSLVFVTTHYAQEYPRSFPPNVIPVGGLALTGKVKPLPKDMEDFINKGKNGFIYISFGSFMDFSKLEEHQKDIMINALLQFPDIQFIWKASGGVGVDLPDNFMVSKWVPQQDLLAHQKIRAFITHGGLGSTNEAIYHGVPMLAFPILADQDFNTNFLEPRGIGISLEISALTTEQFKEALQRIITDQKFARNAMKVSTLFKDRPMTPADTAVWWTEFVLRHDAEEITEYLQSRSVYQSWWVRRQLDVWLFLFIFVVFTLTFFSYVLYRLISFIAGGTKKLKQN